jgi:hypothetical protein
VRGSGGSEGWRKAEIPMKKDERTVPVCSERRISESGRRLRRGSSSAREYGRPLHWAKLYFRKFLAAGFFGAALSVASGAIEREAKGKLKGQVCVGECGDQAIGGGVGVCPANPNTERDR